jgi:succinate dehydrogenase/fumarate reductase flavoprotein subunit
MTAKHCCAGLVLILASGIFHAPPSAQERRPVDAVVVGAGLSGLSAAIEMGRAGVRVLVVDMNSVAGGHAVLAGGVALVGTPVQEKAGVKDSPDLAVKDWMDWTDDGDPAWTAVRCRVSTPQAN